MKSIEDEIFKNIENLVNQEGYINVLAKLYLDNTFVKFNSKKVNELEKKYREHQDSKFYLMRNELNLLYDLLDQKEIILENPNDLCLQSYYFQTLQLCEEIHRSLDRKDEKNNVSNHWREAFFYASEQQHSCQLKELIKKKYVDDENWFIEKKGFSIDNALNILNVLDGLLRLRFISEQEILVEDKLDNNFYKLFTFQLDEIQLHTGLSEDQCKLFMDSFSNKNIEEKISNIDDFKDKKAFPILKLNNGEYFLPSIHLLLEALYITPYYWMINDDEYKGKYSENRGKFAENFCENTLNKIFGDLNVYKNVEIYKGKPRIGEVDVLVLCGEVAIILEVKSKGLSQKSIEGHYENIEDDFLKGVQKACDQTNKCSEALLKIEKYKFKINKDQIFIKNNINKIIPIVILSENYPSLTFQTKEFLKKTENNEISIPYVIDVFFFDILCEYLNSPVLFINFILRRMKYWDNLVINDEYIALAYHLDRNLYFKDENAIYALGSNEYTTRLGMDFIIRREKLDYELSVFDLIKVHCSGFLGQVVLDKNIFLTIELLEILQELMTASEQSWNSLNIAIDELYRRYRNDGKFHSVAMQVPEFKTGFTFCICKQALEETLIDLYKIAKFRKYISKSDSWYAVVLNDVNKIENVSIFAEKWTFNPALEGSKLKLLPYLGQNDLCYCGSNKKFKKCCITK